MTDIVERLRTLERRDGPDCIYGEAADEIERQQADIDKLMSERDGWLQEIERLRQTVNDQAQKIERLTQGAVE